MKKLLFTLVCLTAILTGCLGKDVDPYQGYRGKNLTELFTAGKDALQKKKYSLAVKNFEALDAIYPFSSEAQKAQLNIIYAYYKSGNITSAIVAADRYIQLYPRGPRVDYAYYMRGIAGFDLGLSWLQKLVGVNPASRDISTLQQSYRAFSTLVGTFPQSHYVPDALVRMKYIRNLLAQREIMIAQFYLKRHAYVAAANRGMYVVRHFRGSTEVNKGLSIIAQAYHALGLPQDQFKNN